jgi:putative sterol carrier protein
MSDAIEKAAAALRERFAGADFDGRVKFDVEGEGVIRVAGGEVTTADGEADVTIIATLETFQEMFDGTLSPTAAFMDGRLQVEGDMAMAMQLGQILG